MLELRKILYLSLLKKIILSGLLFTGFLVYSQDLSDLELTKTVNNTAPSLNETITFTIEVYNRGPRDNRFIVTDVLPSGWVATNISTNYGYVTLSNDTINWYSYLNKKIPSGATAILTYDVTVTSCGNFTNTAEITWAWRIDPDSTPGNGQ